MEETRLNFRDVAGLEFVYPEEGFFHFFTRDGLKLANYRFRAKAPKCIVFIFHGLHGYSNNLAVVAKHLNDVQCEVVGLDYRGHGKSEGLPGLFHNFEMALDDCIRFITETSAMYPLLPIYILGQSIGGCICVHIEQKLKTRIRGMILIAPALGSVSKAAGFLGCILSCFSCCCPGMLLVRPNPFEASSNHRAIEYLQKNPYIYTEKVRLGTVNTAIKGMRSARNILAQVETPFVIFQGTADRVVSPLIVENFYRTSEVADKTLHNYAGMGHGVLFEPEIYDMCEKMQKWLLERF